MYVHRFQWSKTHCLLFRFIGFTQCLFVYSIRIVYKDLVFQMTCIELDLMPSIVESSEKRLHNKWHSSKICWMKILFGRIPTKPKYICYHKHEKSSNFKPMFDFDLNASNAKKNNWNEKKICSKLDPFRCAVILDKLKHYIMNKLFGCSWIDWKFMDVSIEKRPQYITFLKSQYITFKVSWSDWEKKMSQFV